MKSMEILKENFEIRKALMGPYVRFRRMRARVNKTNELFICMVKKVPITVRGKARFTKKTISVRFWDFGKSTMEENVNLSLDYFVKQENLSGAEEHFLRDVVYLLLPHTENLLTYAKFLSYRPKEEGDYTKFSDMLKTYEIEVPNGRYAGDFWVAPDNITYWYAFFTDLRDQIKDTDLDARRNSRLPPLNFHTEFKFCPDTLREHLLK